MYPRVAQGNSGHYVQEETALVGYWSQRGDESIQDRGHTRSESLRGTAKLLKYSPVSKPETLISKDLEQHKHEANNSPMACKATSQNLDGPSTGRTQTQVCTDSHKVEVAQTIKLLDTCRKRAQNIEELMEGFTVLDLDTSKSMDSEVAAATLNQDFWDELDAMIQWIGVLNEAERGEALYALVQFQQITHGQTEKQTVGASFTSSNLSTQNRHQAGITKKRQRQNGEKPDDLGDSSQDDSDHDVPKRKKCGADDGKEPRRRLRCPFYLNNPRKYGSMQACSSGMGFEDMSRLKYHLKRVHTQPLRCPCCQQEMQSKAQLKEHLRSGQRCEVLPEPEDDRICQEKWEIIDSLKSFASSCTSVEEKYRRMYQVIFDEENSPSPYERSFLMHEVETELANAIEKILSQRLGPILPTIKEQVPSIIEECKARLNGSLAEPAKEAEVVTTEQMPTTNALVCSNLTSNVTFSPIHRDISEELNTNTTNFGENLQHEPTILSKSTSNSSIGPSVSSPNSSIAEIAITIADSDPKSATSASDDSRIHSNPETLRKSNTWDEFLTLTSTPFGYSSLESQQCQQDPNYSNEAPRYNTHVYSKVEIPIPNNQNVEIHQSTSHQAGFFGYLSLEGSSENDWTECEGLSADPEWNRIFGT